MQTAMVMTRHCLGAANGRLSQAGGRLQAFAALSGNHQQRWAASGRHEEGRSGSRLNRRVPLRVNAVDEWWGETDTDTRANDSSSSSSTWGRGEEQPSHRGSSSWGRGNGRQGRGNGRAQSGEETGRRDGQGSRRGGGWGGGRGGSRFSDSSADSKRGTARWSEGSRKDSTRGWDGGSRQGSGARWQQQRQPQDRRGPWRGEQAFGEERGAYGDEGAREGGEGASGLRSMWIGDYVYGVSPVLAALQAGRRQVHTLYLQEGMDVSKRKDKSAIQTATRRAQELGIKVAHAPKHEMNLVTDNRPHQGLILDASPLEFVPMNSLPDASSVWPSSSGSSSRFFSSTASSSSTGDTATDNSNSSVVPASPPLWLCLDEVMDPQNMGAALRCAYFLGATGVLTCQRNSSPLSAVVSKASAGAMELMSVHSCKSLLQTLGDARAQGWRVLGAAAEPGAVSCSGYVLEQPTILVMGNEGYGLRTTVRRLCDVMLRIDGGTSPFVDSLNVSVATGILLHQLLASARLRGGGGDEAQSALEQELTL